MRVLLVTRGWVKVCQGLGFSLALAQGLGFGVRAGPRGWDPSRSWWLMVAKVGHGADDGARTRWGWDQGLDLDWCRLGMLLSGSAARDAAGLPSGCLGF